MAIFYGVVGGLAGGAIFSYFFHAKLEAAIAAVDAKATTALKVVAAVPKDVAAEVKKVL